MDDQALIRALQAGERAALRRTMEVYAGDTSAVLGNTLRGQASREDLEELLSDVFLSLWRSREGLDPEKSLKSWLAAVARNRAVDFLRRKRETHPVPDGLPDPAPGPEEQAERREAEERLRALVESMGEPDRTLFLRYYYEEEPVPAVPGAQEAEGASDPGRRDAGCAVTSMSCGRTWSCPPCTRSPAWTGSWTG